MKFDSKTGLIGTLDYGNGNILMEGITPNFWRASTDNDFGAKSPKNLAVWKNATKNKNLVTVKFFNNSKEFNPIGNLKWNDAITILTTYNLPDVKGQIEIEYTINTSGALKVTNRLKNSNSDLPHLPRFGNNFIVKNEYQNVEWFGRGPHENYIDRNTAALVGAYKAKVEDLYFPYTRPQENGNKTDVRWVTFKNKAGKGIKIEGSQLLGFSTHHQYNDDFDAGEKKRQTHTVDIQKRDFVNINIDYKQTGVGGDDSWSANAVAHKEFRVLPSNLEYSYFITPLK
jgi:beta-galactosidase